MEHERMQNYIMLIIAAILIMIIGIITGIMLAQIYIIPKVAIHCVNNTEGLSNLTTLMRSIP
jgi:hypothetical protein